MKCTFISEDIIKRGLLHPLIVEYRKNHEGEDFIQINLGHMIYLYENFEIVAALSFEHNSSICPIKKRLQMIRCIRVEQLLVEKNNRRKGYGTKIMKCFFEMIKDKKMDVGLQCVENNKIGRKFFRKMKFRRTGKQHFIITFGEIEKYY